MARNAIANQGLEELGHLLLQLQVLSAAQWQTALRSSGSIAGILDHLQGQPAWWDGSQCAISDYQRQCISSRLTQGLRDLDRDLRINGFLIVSRLGKGGMAVVHKAWSLDSSQIVAVKRVFGNSQILRDRLDREARILKLLDDPRIAQYQAYEPIEDGTGYLLAMEYIAGDSLKDILAIRQRIPLDQALNWTVEILDALAHAHSRSVVHRDVTPANIMICQTGASPPVKLLDFGLSKVTSTSVYVPEIEHEPLTMDQEALGTARYMSPEHFAGTARVTSAADIYSLGCCLYEMLAGRPPFIESQPYQLCFKHSNPDSLPPDIQLFCPGIPEHVSATIRRMLSKRPDERADASEIKSLLLGTGRAQRVVPRQPTSVDRTQQTPAPQSPAPELHRQPQSVVLPYRNWLTPWVPSSPLAQSCRFVDPQPTPVDIVGAVLRKLWGLGLFILILMAVRLLYGLLK